MQPHSERVKTVAASGGGWCAGFRWWCR
jgi:hypothetical protein